MDIKDGYHYRSKIENRIIKVILSSVRDRVGISSPIVAFRWTDSSIPGECEYMFLKEFEDEFSGPLQWVNGELV